MAIYNHALTAKNKRDRRKAKWKVVAFFIPMVILPGLALLVHHQVVGLHDNGLAERQKFYDEIFRTQDKQGIIMDSVITSLYTLREEEMNYYQHKEAQKSIKSLLKEIAEIKPNIPDSSLNQLGNISAIYDSLFTEINLIQFTRDSIKTCEDKIDNQKFQLKECLTPKKNKTVVSNPET